MPDHHLLRRRPSRLILLLAGLLYLFGAAADPIVHAAAVGGDRALMVGEGTAGADDAEPLPLHDESDCLLCKVAGAMRLGLPAGVSGFVDNRDESRLRLAMGPRAPPVSPSSQPRAPPSR